MRERVREGQRQRTHRRYIYEKTRRAREREQESERARERESERARGRESERARESKRVRKREREPIVSHLWTREKERKSENPSSAVCGHDMTESERVRGHES